MLNYFVKRKLRKLLKDPRYPSARSLAALAGLMKLTQNEARSILDTMPDVKRTKLRDSAAVKTIAYRLLVK